MRSWCANIIAKVLHNSNNIQYNLLHVFTTVLKQIRKKNNNNNNNKNEYTKQMSISTSIILEISLNFQFLLELSLVKRKVSICNCCLVFIILFLKVELLPFLELMCECAKSRIELDEQAGDDDAHEFYKKCCDNVMDSICDHYGMISFLCCCYYFL